MVVADESVVEGKPSFEMLGFSFTYEVIALFLQQRLALKMCIFRAPSLVVSDLRSETKGSRFESGCYLCEEVSSLQ